MQVIYSRTALKGLRGMPQKDALALMDKLESYAATGKGAVTRLVGQPLFRLRHGDWRAVFEVTGDVLVLRVAHRREVYE